MTALIHYAMATAIGVIALMWSITTTNYVVLFASLAAYVAVVTVPPLVVVVCMVSAPTDWSFRGIWSPWPKRIREIPLARRVSPTLREETFIDGAGI